MELGFKPIQAKKWLLIITLDRPPSCPETPRPDLHPSVHPLEVSGAISPNQTLWNQALFCFTQKGKHVPICIQTVPGGGKGCSCISMEHTCLHNSQNSTPGFPGLLTSTAFPSARIMAHSLIKGYYALHCTPAKNLE